MDYLQAISGLVLLIITGDLLVRGSVSLAQRMGVSPMVIGLTIIAFGTSAPELVVAIDAVITGAPSLALGNVVGSNIANVLLVLGVPALVAPILCNTPRLGRNFSIMAAVTVIYTIIALLGDFTWMEGILLLIMLMGFLYYSATRSKSPTVEISSTTPSDDTENNQDEEPDSTPKAIIFTLVGLAGLAFGADLLVQGAVQIASNLGVSEAIIGLTLVAIGTSLPELVTTITAAARGHSDVAIGNVIGSNIFNLLAITGISSLFGTIPVPDSFRALDLWVMLASVIILIPFIAFRMNIARVAGLVMLGGYIGYMTYIAQKAL